MSVQYKDTPATFRKLFSEDELRCKASGLLILADEFAEALTELRLEFNAPMPVISGCRSNAHNAAVGGAKASQHICDTGRGANAVDVRIIDGASRAHLIKLALNKGWSVGVKHGMVHLDRRTAINGADPQVLFLYGTV
jgi:hypothetical protein